ncbi:MAG: TatD family hydrolase [Elusimicrobia bacterium]|nr:TatD family hydrolase [Elusimicrobiota bacterium]
MKPQHRFSDTHAHLCDEAFDADRDAVLRAAADAGAQFITEIACEPDNWAKAEALSKANTGFIHCAFGIHPQDCHKLDDASFLELKKFLSLPCAKALGEIGFDYARCDNSQESQRSAMSRLLALANERALPIVLHCRNPFDAASGPDAYADLFSSLREVWKPQGKTFSGVLHCFSGMDRDAVSALDLGLALGANGTATYPKNDPLRDTFRKAGLKNIVLETDCPYLPPQSKRGKRNEPAYIPESAAALAAVFNCAPEKVMESALENSIALYRLAGN